jgi:signal transduction histidine kinase
MKSEGGGAIISDQHSKDEISRFVRDGLAQQLTGILLAARALTRGLEDRHAYEAIEADRLVDLLKGANKEVEMLLNKLR